jgi:hypothetical protein
MSQVVSKAVHDEVLRQLGEARARITKLEAANPSECATRDAAEGLIDEDPKSEDEAALAAFLAIGVCFERLANAVEENTKRLEDCALSLDRIAKAAEK